MSNYYKQAIQILESNGYKLTTPRMQVLKLIEKAQKPVSPYDLQRVSDPSESLNHVTIYRILELFLSLNLVHRIGSGGFVKCDIPDQKGCHHFIICNSCGQTKEFLEEQHNHVHIPKKLTKEFTILSHTYELAGICKKCTK